jgi:predicted dehydrogenase|tara:strand:+ start:9813 stop:10688 length:876 start_codon:yes stop_codon:yes gene_type:complete
MEISLVGAGYWGSKLQKELKTISGVDKVEIIDIKDGKNLNDIQYNNVVLATPAWDHYKQTLELLAQGKNLYVEKPLALTKEECLDIKSKIKDNQTLMVGHIFLYNDRVKKIKELLPRIGKIMHIESNRLNWGRYQKKISTLHSLAPHDVSIIHYLLGYHEFENIICIGDNFTNNTQNDRDEYSFICNDVSVKFNLSWYYPEKIRTMSITGEKGLIFWDEEARTIKLTTDIWQNDRMNYEPTIETFTVESNPLRNELKEFVDCVTTKRSSITDVNNAIQVATNLDLLFKSFS